MQATLPVHTFNRTHQYIWHDSFIHMTRLVYALWRDSFIPMIWLVHKSDMTLWYMRRDPFIQVIWLINTCATTHPYIWHTPFINLTWPIHTGWRRPIEYLISCRSFFAREPLMKGLFCGKWPVKIRHPMGLCHSVQVPWLINIYDMTDLYTWHDSWVHVQRLIHIYDVIRSQM